METKTDVGIDHFQFSVNVRLKEPVGLHPEQIKTAVERLISQHSQAFIGNSPDEILQNLVIVPKSINEKVKQSSRDKRRAMLQRLKQHSLSLDELKKFDAGRKEFRENFVMTDPFQNEEV